MPGPILVVDDEPRLRDIVSEILRDEGFTVITAASGRAALEVLAATPDVALVLTDRAMPGMDGVELFDAIRAMPAHRAVPVAFFSASGDAAGRDATIIPKPVPMDTLLAAVVSLIGPPR
ncbi:MAG TPA: response regulator [Minicystis sp.]|nr:response regulator [Minicystis sp.]